MDYSAEKYKLKLSIKELSKEEKDKLIDELIDNLYNYDPECTNMNVLLSMLKIQTEQTDSVEEQDKIIDNKPYTKIEKEVADNLVKAWNSFCKLERQHLLGRQHLDEIRYFCDGIHECQSVLDMRISRRDPHKESKNRKEDL